MSNVNVKINFHKNDTKMKIRAANEKALFFTGQQALEDSNRYVPEDQGGLTEGSIIASEFSNIVSLNWGGSNGTVYARYQWHGKVMKGTPADRSYGPEELKYTKDAAKKEWAKYAHEQHGAEWRRMYETVMREDLRQ